MDPGSGGVSDPEFDGVGSEIHEGEVLSVGGPDRFARACGRGENDVSRGAVGDLDEVKVAGAGRNAVSPWSVVLAVIAGFDADASEPHEGCSHACDRGVVLPGDQEDGVVRGAYHGLRRRGSVHDIEDVLRRLVVSGRAFWIGLRRGL